TFFIIRSIPIHAQTQTDAIKQTVNNLFIAMKNGDSVLLKNCFTDSAVLQTIASIDGKTFVRNESVLDFAHDIKQLPKGAANEKIVFNSILQD
ncbi:hypothetical protein ABTN51_19430, partial [Acinetobacter baumannii]